MNDPRNRKSSAGDETALDPSSELGLRNPVRDKARLGDAQYSPTPPREAVRPAADTQRTAPGSCTECGAALPSDESLRPDAEEYAYHFCDVRCHDRWPQRRQARDEDDPRRPGP